MSNVVGIVLAAGAGTRFGEPKAPVLVDGERLVDRAVRILTEAGCSPVIVVLGAWVGEVPNALVVVNNAWADGMGSSLRVGLASAADTGAQAAIVTLVDLPGLTAEAVREVLARDDELVVATYNGTRGHPVKFHQRHWNEIELSASGDEGARRFLAGRDDVVFVEVGHLASGVDMDVRPG